MKHLMTIAAVLLVAAMLAPNASADTILSYTGTHYTETSGQIYYTEYGMSVTATIDLADSLGANFSGTVHPLHYSFNDGFYTLTETSYWMVFEIFRFVTDANGKITAWATLAATNDGGGTNHNISTAYGMAPFAIGAVDSVGASVRRVYGTAETVDPGVWTVQEQGPAISQAAILNVPEPSAIGLTLAGLACLWLFLDRCRDMIHGCDNGRH